ncbi:MAG: hypothetical protein SOZ77_05150 [Candidatus Limousia pullorum]|nr:hypothetical protein [Lactobacillus johnsonii]MDY3779532.1 hypothetical protein [Candidatus Limousia pullorum]MDY4500539.1 hypothetical protein [Lactobacillus johnsonii]
MIKLFKLENLFKPKKIYVVLMLIAMLFSTIFSLPISWFIQIQENSKINADGYSVIDKYDDLTVFLKKDNSLSVMKEMYENFNNTWGSSYCIIVSQPVYTLEVMFPLKFCYGYGDTPDEHVDPTFIKAVQMNKNAITMSNIELYEGRIFNQNEYTYTNGKTVPIIVGYEYKEYLNLGDKFTVDYLNKILTLEVVGIAQKGSADARKPENILDYTLIMPAMEFETPSVSDEYYEDEMSFQKKAYLGYINCFVFSDNSALRVQNDLDNICKDLITEGKFILTGIKSINIFNLGYAKSNIIVLFVLPLLFLIIIFIILSILIWKKWREEISNNSETNIDKSKRKAIILKIYAEILTVTFVAGFISLAISMNYRILKVNTAILLGILLMLLALTPLYTIYKLNKIRKHK